MSRLAWFRAAYAAALIVLAQSLGASLLGAQASSSWRAVDLSRQLHDSTPRRIRVQYGAGNVDVRATSDPVLYNMHLRYDETRAVPLHRVDAEQHSVLLGIESRGEGVRTTSGGRGEGGELRLALPRSLPLDLELEFGGTQSVLDLGGMSLQSVRLECGATDANLLFTSPNRVHMRELDVNVGAADFTATRLGNANADQIRVRGGIGTVDLDFSGTWTRDLSVLTRLAVGNLTLRIPSDVGVRLEVQRVATEFDHEGLEKRDDAWYSANWDSAPHKLRIRAETYFGKVSVERSAR
jgi:hypothetical protein